MSAEFSARHALQQAEAALAHIHDLRQAERNKIALKHLRWRTQGVYGWLYQLLFGRQTMETVHRSLAAGPLFSTYNMQSLNYGLQEVELERIEAKAENALLHDSEVVRLTTTEIIVLSRWRAGADSLHQVLPADAGVAQRKGE